jgi:hypothetical protein
MRTKGWLAIALAVWVGLVGGACKKQPPREQTPIYHGVTVDAPKLEKALETAAPQVHRRFLDVKQALHYRRYVNALAELDTIKEDPGLNDEQKRLVDQVKDQVSQLVRNR